MNDNIDIITKHLADLSAGNWAEFRAALHADAIYEESATRQRVKGADNYVRTIQRWKNVFPDLKATPLRTFADGDNVILELEWEGTHDGIFEGPFGTVPPTGKQNKLRAVIVYELNGGKIQESRHYFDLLSLLVQLGVAMPAGAGQRPEQEQPVMRH